MRKKKQRMSKKFRELYRRDRGICGRHYGGCGEKIINPTPSTADIGHIIPKSHLRPGMNSYDPFPPEVHKEIGKKYRAKLPYRTNVQPMHKDCNKRMEAEYPIWPIVQYCSCCAWLFSVESKTDRRKVVPILFEDQLQENKGRIFLARVMEWEWRWDGDDEVTRHPAVTISSLATHVFIHEFTARVKDMKKASPKINRVTFEIIGTPSLKVEPLQDHLVFSGSGQEVHKEVSMQDIVQHNRKYEDKFFEYLSSQIFDFGF